MVENVRSPQAKQKRSTETAGRMLEVAIDLLREGGLEAFTVQAVADRSHRAPASLYRRFGDKDGLLQVAIETYLTRVAELNRLSFEDANCVNLLLNDRVEVLVRGVVTGRARDWRVVDAIRTFERNADNDDFTARILGIQRETRSLLADFLMGSAGEIGRPDPALACQLAIDILIGFVDQRMRPDSVVMDEMIKSELKLALLSYLEARSGNG